MLYLPLESHQQGVMFEFLAIKRKERKQNTDISLYFIDPFSLGRKRRDLQKNDLQDCKNIKCVWLSVKNPIFGNPFS